jgi:DNA-binding NtrC family response regulator
VAINTWGYDVIMIDDNDDDITLMANALQKQPSGWSINWRIHDYHSMQEAQKVLSADGADIVLLDVNLIETQGIETIELAAVSTSMPVVLMTGHLTPEIVRMALVHGFCHSIDKNHAVAAPAYLHFVLCDCLERVRIQRQTERLQRTLTGEYTALVTACSRCHKWRSEADGEFLKPEDYMEQFSNIGFSHGLCPTCMGVMRQAIEKGSE